MVALLPTKLGTKCDVVPYLIELILERGSDTNIRYPEIVADYPKDYRIMIVPVGGLNGREGWEKELTLEGMTASILSRH